jgi:hypothetical protein
MVGRTIKVDGHALQIHWYENAILGVKTEFKHNLPWGILAMRVRSIGMNQADELSLDSKRYPGRDEHDLAVGREYVVLGLSVVNGVVTAELPAEAGFLLPVPLNALEIVSGRPSLHWEARLGEDGIFRLWPPSFYTEFYHSDLADRVPEVIADFKAVRQRIELEDQRGGLASLWLIDRGGKPWRAGGVCVFMAPW